MLLTFILSLILTKIISDPRPKPMTLVQTYKLFDSLVRVKNLNFKLKTKCAQLNLTNFLQNKTVSVAKVQNLVSLTPCAAEDFVS